MQPANYPYCFENGILAPCNYFDSSTSTDDFDSTSNDFQNMTTYAPMPQQLLVRPPVPPPIMRPPMPPTAKSPSPASQGMTDQLAKQIEAEWKNSFPDASILPVIGYPSKGNGVMTLTHSMGNKMPKAKINGLTSLSPLANNALYSAELTGGKWLNLYEIMIPDITPGPGMKSSGEVYVETLAKLGILVQGDHYHWKAMDPFMLAIHSKGLNMHPIEFTRKQIQAIKAAMQQGGH